jgi:deoxyribodipyrimidine photo-lyase
VPIGNSPEADYPYPAADFERESTLARERFSELADRARKALADPEVRRRASLSRDRRQRMQDFDETEANLKDTEPSDDGDQHRLAEF